MTGTAEELDVMARVITLARAGDEVAFSRIVDAYHADMVRVCVVVCRDRSVAEEAVQAAWAIAWRRLATVRDPRRLRPWLVSVAVNEGRQLLRGRRRRSIVEVAPDVDLEVGGVDPAEIVGAIDLRNALARLDPQDRALLAMRYLAGFDSTELAEATGLSPSGVRTRLSRLVARLGEELGDG